MARLPAAMFAGVAVFVGAVETESVVPPSPPADRRREHRESAAVVLASSGKNTRSLLPPCVGARLPTLAARGDGPASNSSKAASAALNLDTARGSLRRGLSIRISKTLSLYVAETTLEAMYLLGALSGGRSQVNSL